MLNLSKLTPFIILLKSFFIFILSIPIVLFGSFKPENNFALIIGSEQYGISENWNELDCEHLKIESKNGVDSINASSAGAIAMWELCKNE